METKTEWVFSTSQTRATIKASIVTTKSMDKASLSGRMVADSTDVGSLIKCKEAEHFRGSTDANTSAPIHLTRNKATASIIGQMVAHLKANGTKVNNTGKAFLPHLKE